MTKRSWDGSHESVHKKPKTTTGSKYSQPHNQHERSLHNNGASTPRSEASNEYQQAFQSLPMATPQADVPAFSPFMVAKGLPELPPLSASLAVAPFRHKSDVGYDRNSTLSDTSYERLEFLGDAYIELMASRLIYHHFPHLTAGSQSQVRELLVKNETLAQYAKSYGFEDRLGALDKDRLLEDARKRGNKGLNKILGDVFEAYVAAAVLSDDEHGFAIVEKWLSALWAPKLLEGLKAHQHSAAPLHLSNDADLSKVYSPTAKSDLQQKILGRDVKLEYEAYRDSVELKGDQLGQNRHYIALYLTGYGYVRKVLGKGEGKNKVEAGNWAAVQALYGEGKDVVQEGAKQLAATREAARKRVKPEAIEA